MLLALSLLSQSALADNRYLIPDSNTRRLTEAELWQWQYDALGFVLNEIFARYGFHFAGGGKYTAYFTSQDWYSESTVYATNEEIYQHEVNNIEWYNESLIKSVRQAMREIGTTNPYGRSITDAPDAYIPCVLTFDARNITPTGEISVYSGPGWEYYRGAGGRARIDETDAVLVAGKEDGWALVMYNKIDGGMRVGYIDMEELETVPPERALSFEYAPATISQDCEFTDDPALSTTLIADLTAGTSVTYLATFTRHRQWAYIEAWVNNRPARGFVPMECVSID